MNGSHVLLCGYYGFGNSGDEALLASIVDGLREPDPDTQIVVVSGDPSETHSLHNLQSVHWRDVRAIADAARGSDLLILGGGSLFQDYGAWDLTSAMTPHHEGLAVWALVPLLSRIFGKPLMLYGVGVGPLHTEDGRFLTRAVFRAADVATVRDQDSHRTLCALGVPESKVPVTADPAFLITPLPTARTAELLSRLASERRSGPVVAVALREWPFSSDPELWSFQIVQALDRFAKEFSATLLFVPFQRKTNGYTADADMAHRFRGRLQSTLQAHVLPDDLAFRELSHVIGSADLVLGMRLHSLVFAALNHKPMVALAYDRKVTGFMQALGLEHCTLALDCLSGADLFTCLCQCYLDREAIRGSLSRQASRMQQLARGNRKYAWRLLKKNASVGAVDHTELDALLARVVTAAAQRIDARATIASPLDSIEDQLTNLKKGKAWHLYRMISRLRAWLG